MKDLKYFMRSIEPEIITAKGPDSIKDENGKAIDFEIKVLPQRDITNIYNKYKRRIVATDKKGNPLISSGEVVYKSETDSAKAARHLMVEALQYPNLKDPALMEYYGCVDITEMPLLVFPKSEEFQYVSRIILSALGLVTDEYSDQGESDIDGAKN